MSRAFFLCMIKLAKRGGELVNLLFVMARQLLADSLAKVLEQNGVYRCFSEPIYSNAAIAASCFQAHVVIVEISENDYADRQKYTALFKDIRQSSPNSKLLVVCAENHAMTHDAIIDAKRKQLIDDFVFCDTSISGLITRIEALV